MLIDTHSHLFLEEFSEDLPQVMERARKAGVSRIFMPNIDSMTIEPMLSVCADYPDLCYPMIGLHPTSVNERTSGNWQLYVNVCRPRTTSWQSAK